MINEPPSNHAKEVYARTFGDPIRKRKEAEATTEEEHVLFLQLHPWLEKELFQERIERRWKELNERRDESPVAIRRHRALIEKLIHRGMIDYFDLDEV